MSMMYNQHFVRAQGAEKQCLVKGSDLIYCENIGVGELSPLQMTWQFIRHAK